MNCMTITVNSFSDILHISVSFNSFLGDSFSFGDCFLVSPFLLSPEGPSTELQLHEPCAAEASHQLSITEKLRHWNMWLLWVPGSQMSWESESQVLNAALCMHQESGSPCAHWELKSLLLCAVSCMHLESGSLHMHTEKQSPCMHVPKIRVPKHMPGIRVPVCTCQESRLEVFSAQCGLACTLRIRVPMHMWQETVSMSIHWESKSLVLSVALCTHWESVHVHW